MQASSKSRAAAAAAPAPEPASVLFPTLIALVATVTLLFLLTPRIVRAQTKAVLTTTGPAHPPEAKTPVVKSPVGTLTGSAHGALAAQTSDKADAAAKDAPKALPKGSKTVAPRSIATTTGPAATDRVSSKPQLKATSAPAIASHADEPATSDSGVMAFDEPVNTVANKIWGANLATQRGARGGDVSTIFQGHAYDPVETEEAVRAVLPSKKPRPRNSEYASAPYVVAAPALLQAGAVGRRAGSAGASFRGIERFVMVDEAEITLPAGTGAVVGARFVSVDVDVLLNPTAQVVAPTGVFEIVRVVAGRPIVARVVQQAGRIEEGQKLLPLEGSAVGGDVAIMAVPRAVTQPETEVVWVAGDALLPSVQSFLMLGAGEREGVKAGDQFALVKRRGLGPDAVEQRVALVRVVRVSAYGSTAIVIRQDQPGISVGGAARLVGRAQ